jgi:hypothetical protein
MRYLIVRHADPDTEAGLPPSAAAAEALSGYHAALAQAGALVAHVSLRPSSAGVRYLHSNGASAVAAGPFVGAGLVADVTTVEGRSLDDAVAWAQHWPAEAGDVTLEVRPVRPLAPSAASRADGRPQFAALLFHDEVASELDDDTHKAIGRVMARAAAAGVLLESYGLSGTGDGVRVKHTNGDPSLVAGPFAGAAEVLGAYALFQADSLDDLQPWLDRVGAVAGTGTSEVRPVSD